MRSQLCRQQAAATISQTLDFRIYLLLLLCLGIIGSHWVLPGGNDRVATADNSYHLQLEAGTLKLMSGNHPPHSASELPAHLKPFFFKRIPVNKADSELLQIIPGIGPELAARIIAGRSELGGFKSSEQLLSVHGIGKKRKEKLEAWLSFE